MAKKTLGYVELEWRCPTCGTRNPGSRRVCQSCGSPQPDDVQFEAPAQGEIRTDEETVKLATAGPDIHCPYCEARNPAGAKVCKQCGGDLTAAAARQAGQIVEGYGAKRPDVQCPACGTMNPAGQTVCKSCGAPLPAAAPVAPLQAAKKPASGGCLWIGAGLAVLALIVVAFLLFSGGRTTATTAEVVDARWTRIIDVQGLVPVKYTGWLDEIPGDAVLGACSDEVRRVVEEPVPGAREVCGTPYAVDQGSGFAEVVVDCVYEIVEQRCEYTVNEWRVVDQITEEGSGFSPQWPALRLSGQQREGDRGERYQCIFSAGGETYVYDVRNAEEYARCTAGSVWSLQVNDSGRVIAAEPVE